MASFPQQNPALGQIFSIIAADTIEGYQLVNRQSGKVGTAHSALLAVAQHSALPGDQLTVAAGGLLSVAAQTAFNATDRGTAATPRYVAALGTNATDLYAVCGTAGRAIVGTSATGAIGAVAQGAWAAPPSPGNPQVVEITWF